jgi:hypothetical protein
MEYIMKNKYLILVSFVLAVALMACSEEDKNGVIDAESITFTGTTDTIYLMKGDVYQLKINTVPAGAPVKFSNTNSDAFRVNQSGEITALAGGLGTVIAMAPNGDSWIKAYCKVLVTENVEEIRLNQANKMNILPPGSALNVSSFFTVLPYSAYNKVATKAVIYKSSHPEYATVDPISGIITVVGKGLTEITAVAADANRVTSEQVLVYAGYTTTALSKTGWTATASTTNGSYAASRAIDGSTSNYWSSANNTQPPHYLLIDMKAAQAFNRIDLRRRINYQNTKDVEFYITENLGDGVLYNDPSFTKIGEITFGTEAASVTTKGLSAFPATFTSRYLLIKFLSSTAANGVVYASEITPYAIQ